MKRTKPIYYPTQFILFLALAWVLASCGSPANSSPTPAATATVTLLASEPTQTSTNSPQPTAVPTTAGLVTETPLPTMTPTLPASATETVSVMVTPVPTAEVGLEASNYYYKGLTYMAAGLLEEALASFDQAIALEPGFDLAYLERGKLYLMQGQLDQARSDYHYALELTTDPVVKAEVKQLLQELASLAAKATTNPPIASPTPAPATPYPTSAPTPAPGPPLEAHLNQEFTLPLAHTTRIEAADFKLTFWELLEDSRCPRQVECFWSGQARLMIQVQQGQVEATMYELNSNQSFKQDTITYAGYEVRLVRLDPYPEDPNEEIPLEAYRATFVVKTK